MPWIDVPAFAAKYRTDELPLRCIRGLRRFSLLGERCSLASPTRRTDCSFSAQSVEARPETLENGRHMVTARCVLSLEACEA